jgi:AcrR family transcriptional regulator
MSVTLGREAGHGSTNRLRLVATRFPLKSPRAICFLASDRRVPGPCPQYLSRSDGEVEPAPVESSELPVVGRASLHGQSRLRKMNPKSSRFDGLFLAMDTSVSSVRRDKAFGLRERNKRDKLRRIKEAATELFLEKGFDDTTTRAIALRADVGLGTVFVYAPTKRDLLFLIINDELQAEVDRSTGLVEKRRSLLDNLMRVFRAHYRYFGRRPTLSRLALREMVFYAAGPQAQRFLSTRERLIALIETIVTLAIDKKEIAPREDAKLVAWVIFSIYQVEIRHWLSSEDMDLNRGVDFLKRQLVLLTEGLSPRRAP